MIINIRKEEGKDYSAVFELVKIAFQNKGYSDQTEHFLVEKLRKSDAFIPELSLVAIVNDTIVGHILLTKVKIKNGNQEAESLSLAPVSVLPAFQGKGVGSRLIKMAHAKAIELGFKSIVLLGSEQYYPKFGYQRADLFGINLSFDAPQENCMVIELVKNALKDVKGMVEYPKAFYE